MEIISRHMKNKNIYIIVYRKLTPYLDQSFDKQKILLKCICINIDTEML